MPVVTYRDTVVIIWENPDGALCEADFDLREAADFQAGRPVSRYGRPIRRWSLPDRLAILAARQDQIASRLHDLADEHPDLKEQ